jgi:hypothetical protein
MKYDSTTVLGLHWAGYWAEYKVRLGKHGERFKAMDINYYPSRLVPWTSAGL